MRIRNETHRIDDEVVIVIVIVVAVAVAVEVAVPVGTSRKARQRIL